MTDERKKRISKFLSLILRHSPERIGLSFAQGAWIDVQDLIDACANTRNSFSIDELRDIVETNDKKRFAFNENQTKIRASQGHSADVKIDYEKRQPPAYLYHGTAEKNIASIEENGIIRGNRHHVHLSSDIDTAKLVGSRHGKPVVITVHAGSMHKDGIEFFVSENGVWLVDKVDPMYFSF